MKLLEERLLESDCASYWLKGAIRALIARDPVDALSDAELLREVMRQRWDRMREKIAEGG